jgi:hypothetical protein
VSLVLVEPEGPSALADPPSRHGPRRWNWVSAAILGVLAAAVLAIGESGGIELMNLSERRLIEAHLDAWYGGDFQAADGLRADQRLRTGPSEERARAEVGYQGRMEADTELLGCEPLPPSTFRCEVSYSNVLNVAVGQSAAIVAQQFGIEDDRILFVAGPYLEDEMMTTSFKRFAELLFPEDYHDSCAEEPGYQTPECAEFKREHIEDWASWHQIEYG